MILPVSQKALTDFNQGVFTISMEYSTILFSFTAFLLFVFFIMKDRLSFKRVPPGPLGLPIIGQSIELLRAMRGGRGEEWLQERALKYGPISKLNVFGTPTVFLTGLAYNKFIFTCTEETLSSKQPTSFRRLLGERNILEMNSEDHKRMRGALLTFLKPEALKQYVGKIDEEIRLHLNQYWHHHHQISVMPLMKTLTFNIISSLLFGIERGTRWDKLQRLFVQLITGLYSVPIDLPFTRFNRSLRARSEIGSIIHDIIHEKRDKLHQKQEFPDDQDLISSLLSMLDEAGSPLLSDDEMVDNCVATLAAGHDTTSSILTTLIKLLAEHRHVYDAVLSEHEEIAAGKKGSNDPLTWEDLSKMKYTWRVATEALRMYPPAIFLFRKVVQDIELGGYVIPKGWQVVWAACMTHMDGSLYPNASEFNPSRYEEQQAVPPHAFMAFGGGARMCPGYEFARIEILTLIHYLVTRFEWKLCLEENTMSRDPMPTFEQGLLIQVQDKMPSDDAMI